MLNLLESILRRKLGLNPIDRNIIVVETNKWIAQTLKRTGLRHKHTTPPLFSVYATASRALLHKLDHTDYFVRTATFPQFSKRMHYMQPRVERGIVRDLRNSLSVLKGIVREQCCA